VEYFNRKLRPYWRKGEMDAAGLLKAAARDYASLKRQCEAFDAELMADLRKVGGEEYARIAALAFRQTIAAHKLTSDWDGTPLLFSKENFSNGSIGTVDVTYPSSPFFLLFNPKLLMAQIKPVLDYAKSPRWRFPFAPHDLGTYPLADGQTYGGGEKSEEDQMPVEESGNILLMVAALAKVEGNARFAEQYWPLLTKWAEYLRDKGLDPENQLSTDDFAGHLAHNTNLSVKAILALGSYAMLSEMLSKKAEAKSYRQIAEAMVEKWIKMADDGDHYRLVFDKGGSWSQKYNLVWDRLLGLKLFPPQIARRELAFYKKKQNKYGLPLDNRETYTKLDWIVWTATMAESDEDFKAFVAPIYKFLNETPSSVPITDWYGTIDGKQRGFQARSVVGGIYIKMLADEAIWKKWSSRASKQELVQGQRTER
jgi:Glutaminase A six helical-hairpin domain